MERVYDSGEMYVEVIPSGFIDTNTYLIVCRCSRKGWVIDPSWGSGEVIRFKCQEEYLHLEEVWLTHSHWDHIADLAFFHKHYPELPLRVHALDKENVIQPGVDGLPCPISLEGHEPSHFLGGGEIFHIHPGSEPEGSLQVEVVHTPGHTPGGVCFWMAHERLLFSGDTLFAQGCGRIDLPTSHRTHMISSLKKLATLPSGTLVLPGHGPLTKIGQELWLKDPDAALRRSLGAE